MRPPPPVRIFFIFMQLLGKSAKIKVGAQPLWLAPSPLGNPGSATALESICTRDQGLKALSKVIKLEKAGSFPP